MIYMILCTVMCCIRINEYLIPTSDARLVICSDSDWDIGSVHPMSYSVKAVLMNVILVARFLHKQHNVNVSSTDAEHFDMSDGCRDGLNVFHFLIDFIHVMLPNFIYMDSQGAISLAMSSSDKARYPSTSTSDIILSGILPKKG